jgi:cytochrome c-type biogenesis protein CcmH/NrfG
VQIEDILDYIQASINAETAAKEALEAARATEHQRELDVARRSADAERRIAEEQRQRAEAETSRARTLRRTTAVVGAAAVLAVTLGAIGWYQFTVAEQRSDATTAALIWSRLDFEDADEPRSEASVRAL